MFLVTPAGGLSQLHSSSVSEEQGLLGHDGVSSLLAGIWNVACNHSESDICDPVMNLDSTHLNVSSPTVVIIRQSAITLTTLAVELNKIDYQLYISKLVTGSCAPKAHLYLGGSKTSPSGSSRRKANAVQIATVDRYRNIMGIQV